MDVQEELKALKERIAELEEQARKEKEFPQVGDYYWRIGDDLEVKTCVWADSVYGKKYSSIGNVFRTKEDAEFAVEKLKVETELRKFSQPFESMTDNFIIVFNRETYKLGVKAVIFSDIQGAIYFNSTTVAEEAIESVGAERIKKYIFGMED